MSLFEGRVNDANGQLTRKSLEILQVNVGKLCNLACTHCHVEAGPKRQEIMTRETAEKIIQLMDQISFQTLDLTGGAPEMNPHFRQLVEEARHRNLRVIDRCNLTVFYLDGYAWIPEFLAENQVEVAASLPCYTKENVEDQRGKGVFSQSIEAIKQLNQLGYGQADSGLKLNLVYNPGGAFLPPDQKTLEADYKVRLKEDFGLVFNQLYTMTNMPIKRFKTFLRHHYKYKNYIDLLINHFNPSTIEGLMCRNTLSVGWDGKLYDCDFNQMLEMQLDDKNLNSLTIENLSMKKWSQSLIQTDFHCFGCTAGSGSSCGGALE